MSTTSQTQDSVATLGLMLNPIHDRMNITNGGNVEGGVTGKMDKLDETKEAIRQVINLKGVAVTAEEPFAVYPEKIGQLPALPEGDDWQPNPTWWDIETILKEDAEDYSYKAIILMGNNSPVLDVSAMYAYKTSDGQFYNHQQAIHTWNPDADKPSNSGYNTRYVIIYGTAGQSVYSGEFPMNALYIVIGSDWAMRTSLRVHSALQGMTGVNKQSVKMQEWDLRPEYDVQIWAGNYSLRLLRADLSSFVAGMRLWAYCGCLKSMSINLPNIKSLNRAWEWCSGLHSLVAHTPKCTNFKEAWNECRSLESLKADLSMAQNAIDAFRSCQSLSDLDLTSIPVNLDLTHCKMLSDQSLSRILSQLVNYTADTPRTLTLGTYLLSRLTAEQKAIATNKNWILA